MSLGKRLKQSRLEARLTQKEVASVLHVSREALAQWELDSTKPDYENLIRIAEHYKVSLDWLLLGKEVPEVSIKRNSETHNLQGLALTVDSLPDDRKAMVQLYVDQLLALQPQAAKRSEKARKTG